MPQEVGKTRFLMPAARLHRVTLFRPKGDGDCRVGRSWALALAIRP